MAKCQFEFMSDRDCCRSVVTEHLEARSPFLLRAVESKVGVLQERFGCLRYPCRSTRSRCSSSHALDWRREQRGAVTSSNRCAISVVARTECSTSSQRMTNSSPPIRATVSLSHAADRSRAAVSISVVAAVVAERVVHVLELVEVEVEQGKRAVTSTNSRECVVEPDRQHVRFARPVSGSCNRRCISIFVMVRARCEVQERTSPNTAATGSSR